MSTTIATRCTCGYEDPEGSTSRYWAAHVAIWPHLRHGIARQNGPAITIRQDWVDAYNNGATIPAIAHQYDAWPDKVRRNLKAAGVALRDDRTIGGSSVRQELAIDLARAERLHAAGHNWRDVADLIGVGLSTLHRYRQEAS